jgi:hypothetical protein
MKKYKKDLDTGVLYEWDKTVNDYVLKEQVSVKLVDFETGKTRTIEYGKSNASRLFKKLADKGEDQ